MNAQQTMIVTKTLTLTYSQLQKNDPKELHGLWQKQCGDLKFDDVMSFVTEWIKSNKFPPTIADVRNACDVNARLEYKDPWYRAFPQDGIIYYNDSDMRKAVELVGEDNWKIPDELRKRMIFKADNTDPIRIELLNKAKEMQSKLT